MALASARDPSHERAGQVFRRFEGVSLPQQLLTTNHVVFESITLARGNISHAAGVGIGEWLYGEKLARIHWATLEEELAAFAYYRKYQDKDYSAVDCLSFVVMERHGIEVAWTLDSDFNHRFTAVPGPQSP